MVQVVPVPSVAPRDRFLARPEVRRITTLSNSAMYEAIRQGRFPKPVKLSPRRVAWSERAVLAWVEARKAEAQVQAELEPA